MVTSLSWLSFSLCLHPCVSHLFPSVYLPDSGVSHVGHSIIVTRICFPLSLFLPPLAFVPMSISVPLEHIPSNFSLCNSYMCLIFVHLSVCMSHIFPSIHHHTSLSHTFPSVYLRRSDVCLIFVLPSWFGTWRRHRRAHGCTEPLYQIWRHNEHDNEPIDGNLERWISLRTSIGA